MKKMKKIILSFGLMVFSITSFSQNFSVTADTMGGTYNVNDYASDYNFIVNNSGGQLNLSFDLLTNTISNNAGWSVTLCTHLLCMPSIPSTDAFGSFADGEQGFFNIHLGFGGTPGTGEISFRVYETTNPSNADTIVFVYTATMTAGTENILANKEFTVFPNPATDYVSINGLENITNGDVLIYSIDGNLVYSSTIASSINNKNIDISPLNEGLYFIKVIEDKKLVYTSQLIKK